MLKYIGEFEKLKEFGFDDECSEYYNYYHEATWCITQIRISKISRKIDVFVCTGDDDCSVSTEDVFDKLFELFSANLVEKVVEE